MNHRRLPVFLLSLGLAASPLLNTRISAQPAAPGTVTIDTSASYSAKTDLDGRGQALGDVAVT
jgi:hypothetical protein